jgi:CheY-like chemotaxis protein
MAARCLIVDDSTAFLRAARTALDGEEITVVGVATRTADALARTEELRPDVVLIDIVLGAESGFTLARRIDEWARGRPDGGAVPLLVMISTHAGEDFVELVAASPAVGFLGKADLSAPAVQELIRRRKANATGR